MIDYALASSTWDDKELAAIQRVIDSNMFTMGEHVAQYEKQFAHFFGAHHAVMVSSGSAANLIMIAALFYTKNPTLKLKRGDEVIVPAVSWSTTYFPLYQYGLKLKFVDIDPDTLNIDLEQLKTAITEETRAIFSVNLLGNPNNFSQIQEIIGSRKIILLEDNCESMGATFDSKQAGSFGVMGSFSSFFSHHIATMEGGCVITNDEELYHIMLCLRAHGWTRNLPQLNHVTGEKSEDAFEEAFKFVLPGYNVRPLEMSGAIGIEQLKKLPEFIKQRQENGKYFSELFIDHPYLSIQKEIGKSSWFGFSMTIKPESSIERKAIVHKLLANGVECRPIVAGNFVKNDVIKYFDYIVHGDLKNSEHIDSQGFFVGNHHYDLKSKIKSLHELLKTI